MNPLPRQTWPIIDERPGPIIDEGRHEVNGSVLTAAGTKRKLKSMKPGPDPYVLQRFVDAQRAVYAQVETELRAGRKESHWMWYIFPQIEGLGHSAMAKKYAISSVAEATEYLNHPELGKRLRECTRLVSAINDRSIQDIFGYPDYLKFQSSMTLFAHATGDNQIFLDALKKYFRSEFDRQTIERL